MEYHGEQIRDQQKQSWNKFSPGWEKWDSLILQFLRPMGDAIINHLEITATDTVLDIATGTGEPGLTIAAIAKKGTVTGTDLSEKMLMIAAAHANARGLKNYSTKVADASELPFGDSTFDKVSCRMGFMYFPDMQLAANQMYRVLKPGGRLAIAVWGPPEQNFWVTGISGVINKYFEPAQPVPGAPGMFRCAKPGIMAGIFEQAGFENIGEQPITGKGDYVDADTFWQHMMEVAAPVVAVLEKAGEATKAAIENDVLTMINAHAINGRALLDFGANIIYGTKPL